MRLHILPICVHSSASVSPPRSQRRTDRVLCDSILVRPVQSDNLEGALVDLRSSVRDDADNDPAALSMPIRKSERRRNALLPRVLAPRLTLRAGLEVLDVLRSWLSVSGEEESRGRNEP